MVSSCCWLSAELARTKFIALKTWLQTLLFPSLGWMCCSMQREHPRAECSAVGCGDRTFPRYLLVMQSCCTEVSLLLACANMAMATARGHPTPLVYYCCEIVADDRSVHQAYGPLHSYPQEMLYLPYLLLLFQLLTFSYRAGQQWEQAFPTVWGGFIPWLASPWEQEKACTSPRHVME